MSNDHEELLSQSSSESDSREQADGCCSLINRYAPRVHYLATFLFVVSGAIGAVILWITSSYEGSFVGEQGNVRVFTIDVGINTTKTFIEKEMEVGWDSGKKLEFGKFHPCPTGLNESCMLCEGGQSELGPMSVMETYGVIWSLVVWYFFYTREIVRNATDTATKEFIFNIGTGTLTRVCGGGCSGGYKRFEYSAFDEKSEYRLFQLLAPLVAYLQKQIAYLTLEPLVGIARNDECPGFFYTQFPPTWIFDAAMAYMWIMIVADFWCWFDPLKYCQQNYEDGSCRTHTFLQRILGLVSIPFGVMYLYWMYAQFGIILNIKFGTLLTFDISVGIDLTKALFFLLSLWDIVNFMSQFLRVVRKCA